MIKSIIFDWGGVLIHNPTKKILHYISKNIGIEKKKFLKAYKLFEDDFQKGIISEDEMWERVCNELNISKPKQKSLWKNAFIYAYSPKKQMFFLASKLKDKGHKIGFLSNTEVPAMEFFFTKNYDMFNETVFSCNENLTKPGNKIYELALKKLDVKPHEAIFIDDKPKFVDAAKQLGINAILFKNIEQVKKEIKKLT